MLFATAKIKYFKPKFQEYYNANLIQYSIFKFTEDADSGYIYHKPDVAIYMPNIEYEITLEFPFVTKSRYKEINDVLRGNNIVDIVFGKEIIGRAEFIFWDDID